MTSTTEIEVSPGVVSFMRKNARKAINLGIVVTVAGVLMGAATMFLKQWEAIPIVVAEITGGQSLIALALGAKAWQSQAEERHPEAPAVSPDPEVKFVPCSSGI
jgi:hypothetical protein